MRECAGLTQVQLASRLGYDHTYISKVESGHRVPGIAFASQADDVLNAGGALLALATNARAERRAGGKATVACGPLVTPVPCASSFGDATHPTPRGPIQLPALGITCPLHSGGCSVLRPSTASPLC